MSEDLKGQKSMMDTVIKKIILSRFNINKEEFETESLDILEYIMPEDLDIVIESIINTDSLKELKNIMNVIVEMNKKVSHIQEENQTLRDNLNSLSQVAAGLEIEAEVERTPEMEALIRAIEANDFSYGTFLYEIIKEQKMEGIHQYTKLRFTRKDNLHSFEEFIGLLEVNNVVSREDKNGRRKVLIPHLYDLNKLSNQLLFCSNLTGQYAKTALARRFDIPHTQFVLEYDKLLEEGWFAFNGNTYVKGSHRDWNKFSIEYWINNKGVI